MPFQVQFTHRKLNKTDWHSQVEGLNKTSATFKAFCVYINSSASSQCCFSFFSMLNVPDTFDIHWHLSFRHEQVHLGRQLPQKAQ